MKNDLNDILNQQNRINSFQFKKQQTALLIKAHIGKIIYSGRFPTNSFVSFDSLKESLEFGDYQILEQTYHEMKVKVAKVVDLDFVTKEKIVLDELRQDFLKLSHKLQSQIDKNQQLIEAIQTLQEKVTHLDELNQNQQIRIQTLSESMVSLRETVQRNYTQNQNQFTTLRQNLEDNQSQQEEKNNLITEMIEQHSAQLRRKKQLENRINGQIEQLMNQNNHIKLVQQSNNLQTTQNITNLTAQLTQLRNQFNQLLTQTIPKCVTYEKLGFFHDSQVVFTPEEKSTIRNFFARSIKQVKLLYRASDNGFCIKKFHEKCDEVANTLTVVWTEFDRKIGGFTPLKWGSKDGQYEVDDSDESFMFSLSHKDKFSLKKPQHAIFNYRSYGPTFGGAHDLIICDKANSQNNSGTNICSSYHNEKYKSGVKASLDRFHGGSTGSYNFKTKDWEVWLVEWA